MKKLLITTLILVSTMSFSQKYFTKSGLTEFQASVETFEPVEAKSNNTTAILNTTTGEVATLLFIKTFHFKVALMEEHFNENYMESDKFPKASYKGKLLDFDVNKVDASGKDFITKGKITIHGVTKEITTKTHVYKKGKNYIASSTFTVLPNDFGIEIPSIVKKKIAEKITISFEYELIKKN